MRMETTIHSHADTLPSQVSESASSSAAIIVIARRGRRSKSAEQNGHIGNSAGVLHLDNGDNVACSNSTDDAVQSTVLFDSSLTVRSGESALVKTRSRRRTKSAAPAVLASSEETSSGQTGCRVASAQGWSTQQDRVVADIDSVDVTKSVTTVADAAVMATTSVPTLSDTVDGVADGSGDVMLVR